MRAPSLVTDIVKQSICPKTEVPGMEKPSYLPSCLQQCSELCGVKCRRKCWGVQHPKVCNSECKQPCLGAHPPCGRGKLGEKFMYCPSYDIGNGESELSLSYITFETVDVTTYGKGSAFTRVEKVENKMLMLHFITGLVSKFTNYADHVVTQWFLR